MQHLQDTYFAQGVGTIIEEDSQNYMIEKADELYDLIEYEESEPMPEDEDGMNPLQF
jgi:hypothetical protein